MSRSEKKNPITGMTTAETEKDYKRQEHSRERAKVRDALRTEKEILPHAKEFGNPWSGPKDGKRIWSDNLDKAKRK